MTLLFWLNLWVVLVGAARKWVLPGASDYLFFSIHGAMILFYCGAWRQKNVLAIAPKWFYLFFAVIFFWSILGAILSDVSNIYITLLGLMNYLLFAPLAIVASCAFKNSAGLLEFLKRNLFLAFPILILGFAQYFGPPDSFINKYASDDFIIALVGDRPRITGTFSYLSGYTTYLQYIFSIYLALAFSKRNSISTFYKWIFVIGLLTNVLMTGARGLMGIMLVSTVIFLGILFLSQIRNAIKVFVQFGLIMLVCSIAISFNPKVNEAYSNFVNKIEKSTDIGRRLSDNFSPFKFLDQTSVFGYGIGTTYPPAQRFVTSWGNMPRDFEDEPERVALEMGLIGYLLVYGWRLMILLYSWFVFCRLKNRDFKLIVLTALIFQMPFLQLSGLVFNVTAAFYYWLCVGIVFAIQHFEKKEISFQKKSENLA